jgi:hypothetical protein|tara:strand:- start:3083 stop:3259 length:177 start_codon:yes stop_codon:yes gene_type:complete
MGRTYRFNKKDGRGSKPKNKPARAKKMGDFKGNERKPNYDDVEQSFERFANHGKPRKS